MTISAAATVQTRGKRFLTRTVLFTVGMALLTATAPQQAGAETAAKAAGDRGNTQAAACQLLGGTATIENHEVNGSLLTVIVRCEGGLLGGMKCVNGTDGGTGCEIRRVRPGDGAAVSPTGGIEADLGTGLDIEQILADLEGPTPVAPVVSPPADTQDHDQDNGKAKGKNGKSKGKKGGKGRNK